MRLIAKAFGLVLVLLTSACLVETENTLSDPDPKALDEKLLGTWHSADGGEVTLFSAAADDSNNGTYKIVYAAIRAGAEKPVEFEHYSAWRTVLDGKVYLNVVRSGGNSNTPKTMIVTYDLGADGTLALRVMNAKFLAAAIDAGKLKGKVKQGDYVEAVTITATRAELVAFVAASDRNALFAGMTAPLHKLADTKQ